VTYSTELPASVFPASIAVLIPAWKPQPQLISFVHSLVDAECAAILVVDDGSGPEYRRTFDALARHPRVAVLRHAENRGKGSALKTGLDSFLSDYPEYAGIVSADADGQHSVEDVVHVAHALTRNVHRLVLGSRNQTREMPLRSWFGNTLTRYVFRAVTGAMLLDTQTGLRGFPAPLVPELLAVNGERYEYETAVLIAYCRAGRVPVEIPIRTLYTENNRSSHFRPIADSLQIYRILTKSIFESRPARARAMDKATSAQK
jgi:glycosyltransferase involved in cell wall biosynthesis